MTSKTKTITKKSIKSIKKEIMASGAAATLPAHTYNADNDFKTAVMVVSLTVNMFILTGWVALKVTSEFDYQVAMFLFYR